MRKLMGGCRCVPVVKSTCPAHSMVEEHARFRTQTHRFRWPHCNTIKLPHAHPCLTHNVNNADTQPCTQLQPEAGVLLTASPSHNTCRHISTPSGRQLITLQPTTACGGSSRGGGDMTCCDRVGTGPSPNALHTSSSSSDSSSRDAC